MDAHGTGFQRENMRKRSKKRMDEREMEEDGKNRKGKGWGIGIKMFFFWNCYFMFKEKCNQESESA
jgi:hypothetical protein